MQKIKAYLQDFMRYRYLLYNLISKDFKLKYRRSMLGILWSVLNPLLMALIMYLVFSNVFNMRGQGVDNFAVYLMLGQLMFNFFSESTGNAMGCMLSAAPLLKKVYVPKYIFPMEKVCFALVNTAFSTVALIILMVITGAPLHATALLFFIPLFTMFLFNLGLGLVLAALAVFFRDIMHLWGVFVTALLYFSAIFYTPDMLSPFLQKVILFNPVYWYIATMRQLVLYGALPTKDMLLVCCGCAAVTLAAGVYIFRKNQDKFVFYL